MTTIAERVHYIQDLIQSTAQYYQRSSKEILLLAVSKGHSVEKIQEAYQAGLKHFGENQYQEAWQKIQTLHSLPICWHFIGPIQSNKAKGITQHFHWVHSLSRKDIAELLSKHRPGNLPPLSVCLQINLDNEATKTGIKPEEAAEFAEFISKLPQLKLRGLMAIPILHHDEQLQYESLLRLNHLMNDLNKTLHLSMDTLSMGMSEDLIAAIRAGSTIVRIGRALFGERI
ncbi:YggS family pyridoxal phosphate-dependent enzyme [Legionella hackeliae]|uniref:Pyridoxal phosphate homeostasis protein n=1 Tax=Legionella hackeliae TaxID=449 RepID=A0A0A8URR4_LEGHA|nr:YggS family pyridoxal phosphate-dependent enzyme [Legionella hackeliae]KTD10284.1 pyridoxal-5'-phosphate dependent enzyme family transporter protein [Legionella hackeliae]CEK09782.1 putative enzyme [Legionella hackeliae]STX49692.1 pyridoxal-5'-phosphate dependent enzyme family [Legionella hackeliae]